MKKILAILIACISVLLAVGVSACGGKKYQAGVDELLWMYNQTFEGKEHTYEIWNDSYDVFISVKTRYKDKDTTRLKINIPFKTDSNATDSHFKKTFKVENGYKFTFNYFDKDNEDNTDVLKQISLTESGKFDPATILVDLAPEIEDYEYSGYSSDSKENYNNKKAAIIKELKQHLEYINEMFGQELRQYDVNGKDKGKYTFITKSLEELGFVLPERLKKSA